MQPAPIREIHDDRTAPAHCEVFYSGDREAADEWQRTYRAQGFRVSCANRRLRAFGFGIDVRVCMAWEANP